jgi:hypothetical protein
MEQAKVAATAPSAAPPRSPKRAGSQDPSLQDVEYIRMFAKVAQVQFRAVLNALNEHVSRLGELTGTAKPPRSS